MAAAQPQQGNALQQPRTIAGGIRIEEALQAASQPGELGYFALNELAKQHNLDQQQRAGLFSAASQGRSQPIQDLSQIPEWQSGLNSFLNQASLRMADFPTNPEATGSNVLGAISGGLATPIAVGLGLASLPVSAPAAATIGLTGAAGVGALTGFNESAQEAAKRGVTPSLPAALLRGGLEGGLTLLPTGAATDDIYKVGKQLARNAGIAGVAEVPISAATQALQNGSVSARQTLMDVAGQVGGQLGGDFFERLRLRQGALPRTQAFDTLRSIGPAPQAKAEVSGRIISNEEFDKSSLIASEIEDLRASIDMLRERGMEGEANKLLKAGITSARLSAGEATNDVDKALFKEQAKTLEAYLASFKKQSKARTSIEKLQTRLENVEGFELQGNVTELKKLSRLGRNVTVTGETDEVKQLAGQLAAAADGAIKRLGPTTKAKPKVDKQQKVVNRLVDRAEKIEKAYDLASQGKPSKKALSSLRTKAEALELDPDAPAWLREYATRLKEQVDEDLTSLKETEAAQKAIKQAKERTAVAERKRADKDRAIGLKELRKDIKKRSKAENVGEPPNLEKVKTDLKEAAQKVKNIEGPGGERVKTGVAKANELTAIRKKAADIETDPRIPENIKKAAGVLRNKVDQVQANIKKAQKALRKAAIEQGKPATEAAAAKKKLKARSMMMDTKHEGMTETPNQIRAKLDRAVGTDQVFRIKYYAEKTGSNIKKPFLERLVTIDDAKLVRGKRMYTTIDQQNAETNSRKLFDGLDDSRITSAEPVDVEARYVSTDDGDVVFDRQKGERVPRKFGQEYEKTSTIEEALKVKDRVDSLLGSENTEVKLKEYVDNLTPEQRADLYKQLTGDDC